jgi:hypothetical protein
LYGIPGETFPFFRAAPKNKKLLNILDALNKALQSIIAPIPSALIRVKTLTPDQFVGILSLSGGSEHGMTAGIIYGYAYEGHCYDMPKPKIMLIPVLPQEIPAGDCGYDQKGTDADGNSAYKVWVVDKLDECVDIDVSQGYIEQMVLDANLPGQRSPTMYAAKARLAHRSGRMME